MKIAGLIPARYGSSRLPGKPLALIAGKPMIQHVYERCMAAPSLTSVWVCTDDARVLDAVEAFGGRAVMTRADHISGTDRVAEAAQQLDADIIVNIQGDQPFIHPDMLDEVARPLLVENPADVATLMFKVAREDDLHDPAVVKVVTDLAGNALYFSRSLIPYPRENVAHAVYEHAGTYAYRKDTLQRLTQLTPTALEKVESLEQLRWLQHGLRIQVIESQVTDPDRYGFSVDTPADLARAEQMYGMA
ncbi:MAG TPA: 3-deoxy-manno-octulosonate cytidylyltransferase [Candidatus Hydrogenedentes bacterium]|nr:3-deoxy-manno-octulosonate cytidylyltransferase [Candidatus Hydrogenedentota bacterium]